MRCASESCGHKVMKKKNRSKHHNICHGGVVQEWTYVDDTIDDLGDDWAEPMDHEDSIAPSCADSMASFGGSTFDESTGEQVVGGSVFWRISYRPPSFVDAPETLQQVDISQIGAGLIAVLGDLGSGKTTTALKLAVDLNLPSAIITNEVTVDYFLFGYQKVFGTVPSIFGEIASPKNGYFLSAPWQAAVEKACKINSIRVVVLDSLTALRDAEINIKCLNFFFQMIGVICIATRIPTLPLQKNPLFRQVSFQFITFN